MHRTLSRWLRKGVVAVAGLALLLGASLSARASSLVGVYQKNGFEYLVNLGDGSAPLTYNANVTQFGGTTAGALFSVVSVVNRNLVDSLGISVGNIIYSKTGTIAALTDDNITAAQGKVAGFGTADSWFDLIPTIANGAPGTNTTIQNTAGNAFAVKVDNTFFGNFPFSIAGTIDGNGNLTIGIYQAIASDPFDNTPQVNQFVRNLKIGSTGLLPEPTSIVLLGAALAGIAALRRRSA